MSFSKSLGFVVCDAKVRIIIYTVSDLLKALRMFDKVSLAMFMLADEQRCIISHSSCFSCIFFLILQRYKTINQNCYGKKHFDDFRSDDAYVMWGQEGTDGKY
jgi:hypothetical protein